jgi:phosphatidylserine synthase
MKGANFYFNNLIALIKSQAANSISLLGIIPVFLLLYPQMYSYFPLIASFNILADDLDGIVARSMGTNSERGRFIDILCDAFSHIVLLMAAAKNHGFFIKLLALTALVSMISRLASSSLKKVGKFNGTTTNEYVVSMHLVIALELLWGVNLEVLLAILTVVSIVTLNMNAKIKTLRRIMNNRLLITFDILLVLASFFPGLALLLLSLHILFFFVSLALLFRRISL